MDDDAPPGTEPVRAKPARASAVDFFDAAPADQAAPLAPPPPPPPPPPLELPPGWTAHPDQATGATYYWNAGTGATSWEVPTESSNPSHAAFLAQTAAKTPSSRYISTLLGDAPATGATDWVKHSDATSGVPYFSNAKTNATTWDPPPEGFVDATTQRTSEVAADPYAANATFNRATGRFEYADGGNHWDARGIPRDSEGRQLSHYFDLDNLEQNRADAQTKQQKLKHKKYDWRKYKAAKKKEKVKRQVQKLLED